jgi:hypothetical protein
MRSAVVLFVLAMAVAVHASTCPPGMHELSWDERGQLLAVGAKAFTTNAQAGICDKLPAYILDFSEFRLGERRRNDL